MKTAVIVLHGGNFHPSHEAYVDSLQTAKVDIDRLCPSINWKQTLQEELGEDYEVFLPYMPLRDNAEYELWKLWFEKVMGALNRPCVLIGHSLGAMFLLKYLSEQKPKNLIKALFLIAPEYLGSKKEHEKTCFDLKEDISSITEVVQQIVFFHSENDPVVLYENQSIFQKLLPKAQYITLSDKGHFNVEQFPELLERIKEV